MSRLERNDRVLREVIAGPLPRVEAFFAGVPADEYEPEPGSWLARLLGGEEVRLRGWDLLDIIPDIDTGTFFVLTADDELVEVRYVSERPGVRGAAGAWERV